MLLLLGLILVFAFATMGRALLAEAEAEGPTLPADTTMNAGLASRVLASQAMGLVGLAMLCLGWEQLAQGGYSWLRMVGMSRLLAAALVLVAPAALLAVAALWLGYLVGQAYYGKVLSEQKLWQPLLWPAFPIAWPAGRLLASPHDDVSAHEALRALAASPDQVWQRVQQGGSGGNVAAPNRQIFDNAAELPTIRVRECMEPRTGITAIEQEAGIEGLRQAVLESGYSKIPIYRDTLDNVLGYVHSSALFRKPKALEEVILDILTVPESMTASQLLVEFARARKSIAIVVDEYGGTSGIVTMEDVMEEIFGEIDDELDEKTETERQESPSAWILSARLEVDYLNEKYDWDLPVGDYESLGGLIVAIYQDLPEQGATIEAPPFYFDILEMAETRVSLVRLRIE